MTSSRRDFLKSTVSAALGASALSSFPGPYLWAQDKTRVHYDGRSLVVIYLRGGADPLNTIIPFADRDYYAIRPTIAIPHPASKNLAEGQKTCIPITKKFGLHPALAPLAELYQQGKMAIVLNTGSTHPTRSHFDAQDFMEWAAPGIKSIQEGWLNRYLQATRTPDDSFLRAFCPQPLLPRSLRGEYAVLAAPGPGSGFALDSFEGLYPPCDEHEALERRRREEEKSATGDDGKGKKEDDDAPDPLPPITEEELNPRLRNAGARTVEKLRHLNRILGHDPRQRLRGYPRGRLPAQLADIAAVIKAGEPLEISAVDYGGWDHHSYQAGQMDRMLQHLAQSIAAFARDLGDERMKRVTVLTMTEFGRTVRENGSQGTDHGHGGFMLAVGGPIHGGQIYGKWTGLGTRALYEGRDLPVWVDFRDVFAETLAGLFRFDVRERPDFFPAYEKPLSKPLKLFQV